MPENTDESNADNAESCREQRWEEENAGMGSMFAPDFSLSNGKIGPHLCFFHNNVYTAHNCLNRLQREE